MKIGESDKTLRRISHNLLDLANHYNNSEKINRTISLKVIKKIDTKPSARYGELIVSKKEALDAQFAVFEIINEMYK